MGCIFGKNAKSESQSSNGGRGRKPPLEACLRYLGTSKNKLPLAARTKEIHGHAFPAIRAVLQSDREMEIPKAKKGLGLCGFTGLDTSILCQRENYGCDVVFFTADVGRGVGELEGLEAKAKASGASQLVVKDLKGEFVRDFIFPCLRAGAIYERKYLTGTSMAHPAIANAMVDIDKEVGADAVSQGCTGKGNDQACLMIEL